MTEVTFNIIDGMPDYTVSVNSETYTYSTTGEKTISLPSGDHVLTITDRMGCSVEETFNIPVDLFNGLLAVWELNGNAEDSYNGFDGTVTGATPIAGKLNQAYSFDGNDKISMGNVLSLERTTPFSISAWVKTDQAGIMTILGKTNHSSPNTGYALLFNAGKIQFLFTHILGTNGINILTDNTYNDNQLRHVVITYSGDGDANSIKIYVDSLSVPFTINNNNLSASTVTSANFSIGSRNLSDVYYTGEIDQCAIWNTEIGQLEVNALNNSGDGLPYINWDGTPIVLTDINYGYLYNWYAANDIRGIAGTGWHLPTHQEWSVQAGSLAVYVGDSSSKLREVGITHWIETNTETNEYNFNARGSGYRDGYSGVFEELQEGFHLWFAVEYEPLVGFTGRFYYDEGAINTDAADKHYGHAIRLIKDTTTLSHGETGTYIGNDGKIYRTICIGTQEWLADSLAETLYQNLESIPEVTDDTTWIGLTTGARCSYNNDELNAINS